MLTIATLPDYLIFSSLKESKIVFFTVLHIVPLEVSLFYIDEMQRRASSKQQQHARFPYLIHSPFT